MTKVKRRARLILAGVLTVAWLHAPVSSQRDLFQAADLSALKLRTIGPANMSGRIVDLAVVESNPDTFYAASATGGIWKTTDNGVTFTSIFEHESTHSIGAIAVYQANPSIVWVGTGERASRQSSSWGDGVYKSTDSGKTWTNVGLRDSHHIGRIALHPANADVAYVAAMGHLWGPNDERGLYRTTDGGRTWTKVLHVNEDTGVVDVALDPSNPDILYAASYQRRRRAYGFHGGGPGSALHKSIDGGRSWKKLTNGLPDGDYGRIGISIYRRSPRIVYICVEQGLRYSASTSYEQRKAGVYRSEDAGETWRHMSDWNPRPMYASQILVDPNDDQRVYMVNSFSISDDGGKTFTAPRQSLHGDDRIVWVNPRNSNHLMKGDDGGLGISYDRGLKWLYVPSLPVSQYYRLSVGMQRPYWICGGLQDNGSWCGPSATYESWGVLNEHWVRVGGGDGFSNLIDPTDPTTVYSASQYLGLTRVDLASRETVPIRPGDPTGHISGRRNWKTWGQPGAPEPLLGNAMEPANWDAPFILSPHDPKTIYAGTRQLWRSTDRGESWTSLGDLTTGVDRSTLTIMGQKPGPSTLSLDDGVPYYPTLTAVAESPLTQGLLYVGTDDGNLQVSRDAGRSWVNVASRLPGLPKNSWVSGIHASSHREGTVYVAFDNHASNDFGNYLYRSVDYGQNWTSIVGDLPPNRVIKAVHEDPRNPKLIYIGTEFGFFLSPDGGRRWLQLKNNMPTVPVNDFVIHPRENDLVLATHGRGIWILDKIGSLQELTPEALTSDAHLFSIAPAEMIRYSNPKAHAGDMIFRGDNPPAGAVVDYWLGRAAPEPLLLSVHNSDGAEVRRLKATTARGVNRVIWDLRHEPIAAPSERPERRRRDEGISGPFVVPGEYTVRLNATGKIHERKLVVTDDPRLTVPPAERRRWTETQLVIGEMYKAVDQWMTSTERATDVADLRVTLGELRSRIEALYRDIAARTGPLTADQRARLEYFRKVSGELESRVKGTRSLQEPNVK